MDVDGNIDSNVAVLAMLENHSASPYKQNHTLSNYNHSQPVNTEETESIETSKQNIIWTKNATLLLLSLYETKMHMLDNPKKKSKMWISIAEELKSLSVEVTPDQVRWKINALTKKYKDCIESGQGNLAFKYFNEMHQILGRYNDDNGVYRLASDIVQECNKSQTPKKIIFPTASPFRKLRAERRAKVELDKQWLEYLKRQEEQRQIRDERYERSLRLREEELALRKKELEIKESLALKRLQLQETKLQETLKIEREKCNLLRKFLGE